MKKRDKWEQRELLPIRDDIQPLHSRATLMILHHQGKTRANQSGFNALCGFLVVINHALKHNSKPSTNVFEEQGPNVAEYHCHTFSPVSQTSHRYQIKNSCCWRSAVDLFQQCIFFVQEKKDMFVHFVSCQHGLASSSRQSCANLPIEN